MRLKSKDFKFWRQMNENDKKSFRYLNESEMDLARKIEKAIPKTVTSYYARHPVITLRDMTTWLWTFRSFARRKFWYETTLRLLKDYKQNKPGCEEEIAKARAAQYTEGWTGTLDYIYGELYDRVM